MGSFFVSNVQVEISLLFCQNIDNCFVWGLYLMIRLVEFKN